MRACEHFHTSSGKAETFAHVEERTSFRLTCNDSSEKGPGPGGGGQELVHKWTWMLVLVCKMDSYGEVTHG